MVCKNPNCKRPRVQTADFGRTQSCLVCNSEFKTATIGGRKVCGNCIREGRCKQCGEKENDESSNIG